MFIEEVMSKIWEPEYKEYEKMYAQIIELDADTLYQKVCNEKMGMIEYTGLTMNLLSTCGCPHRFRENKISGCSMCNYQSKFLLSYAVMKALRKKDINLYARAVKDSFVNARGKELKANAYELITGNDSFSEEEFPDEVLKELFVKEKLFTRPPFWYILEARASSVTEERLALLKDYLGQNTRVMIELGLESGNDWIRNYWINKEVTNREIERAVELIHKFGYKVSMDIIIGIPGLTEQQSVDLFVEAVLYANRIEADEIICIPLNRKEGTLQGFLHRELKGNQKLQEVGLVNGEHTGIPWLFTIMDAIYSVLKGRLDLLNKINFAQLSSDKNLIDNTIPYNAKKDCICNRKIMEAIDNLNKKDGYEHFIEVRKEMHLDPCFQEYQALLRRQERCKDLKDTIQILGREITMVLWKDEGEEQYLQLLKELSLK